MLRPAETTQKLLISSPARFIAEFEAADYVVTHAWRFGRRHSDDQSPLRRAFFVLSFTTPEVEKAAGVQVPDYGSTGELISAFMAVLYGKRFDYHGAIEMNGLFRVPDLSRTGDLCGADEPYYSSKTRADYPIPLDLRELVRLKSIIEVPPTDVQLSEAFKTAALFYARAIRAVDQDVEVAYIHLITAIERLSEATQFDAVDLEAPIRTALDRIERELKGGLHISRLLRGRMRQLKRRFTALVTSQLDEAFFARAEAQHGWAGLKSSSFPRAAAAAYDLRSRYLHTGACFGSWVAPEHSNKERQLGRPVTHSRDWGRIIEHAPTFIGLERITRFVMLKCAERLGARLDYSAVSSTALAPGTSQES